MGIGERFLRIRREVPEHVTIVVAAKQRTAEEIREVIDAGARHLGENYVQEAEQVQLQLADAASSVTWHMIGHLQKNKINKALPIFDVVQTVDSLETAQAIDRRAEAAGKAIVAILLEINVGNEDAKAGIRPEDHEQFPDFLLDLARSIGRLPHVRLDGLMSMGPLTENAESLRPHFRRVRGFYELMRDANVCGVSMQQLSMGMSESYRVAIEEGANTVRIGTAIFGPRAGV